MKSAPRIIRLLPIVLWLSFSCSEDETDKPPVAVISYIEGLDRINLDGTYSKDEKRSSLTYEWSSSNENITINRSDLGKTYFKIPSGTDPTTTEITLKVRDAKHESEVSVSMPVPALNLVRSYGIGRNLTAEADNSAPYSWYFDQENTGPYSSVNCGPTSVTMAIKWANENFSMSPEDARNTFRSQGGWWYTDDIIRYLNLYHITNWTISLSSPQVLKNEIDNNNIIILCLDMYRVGFTEEQQYRVGKFYTTANSGWGHFIVLKGYKVVDDKLFFEVYDPYSWGKKYIDQTLKGMNRYYSGEDLNIATQFWWDYAIIISKSPWEGGRHNGVDVNTIVHKSGR